LFYQGDLRNRTEHIAACFGRLKEGVSLPEAKAELDTIHERLIAQYPDTDKGYGLSVVTPGRGDYTVYDYAPAIWLVAAGVSCLLLISCANIANLLLARSLHRRNEISVRAIGIVPHVRYNRPDYPQRAFQAYFPYTQNNGRDEVLLLRTGGNPTSLITPVRKMIGSIDPNLPVTRIEPLNDAIAKVYAPERIASYVTCLFSGAALFLCAVGLYGVLAYAVAQRTREIGIRIAVGARSANILQLVVRQGLKLTGIGLVIGIVAALALARVMSSMLYGVSADDPISLLVAILVLSVAALLACLLPALRATRIDPIAALRE
jgi:hypothetical protein